MSFAHRTSLRLGYRVITLEPWFRHPVLRTKVALACLLPGWAAMMGLAWLSDVRDASLSPVAVASPAAGRRMTVGLRPAAEAGPLPIFEQRPGLTKPMSISAVMRWPALSEIARPDPQATGISTAAVPLANQPLPSLRQAPAPLWQLAVYRSMADEAEIQAGLLRAQERLSQGEWAHAREQLQSVLRLDPDRIEALERLWQLAKQRHDDVAERDYADRLQQLLPDYFTEDTLPSAVLQDGQD